MLYLLKVLTTVVVVFGGFGSATVHERPFNLTLDEFNFTPYFPFPDFYFYESRLNTFDASVDYLISKKSGLDVISLDVENLVIANITSCDDRYALLNFTVDGYKLHIYLPPKLVNKTKVGLNIRYTGVIYTDREEGFYVTEYPDVDAANFNKLYVGHFRSDNLRTFIPCTEDTILWGYKGIGISEPYRATAISNAQTKYFGSHKPTLLTQVTFVIGNLSITETRSSVNLISHKDHLPQLKETLEIVAACRDAFSDFHYKNAPEKISVVGIPSIAKLRVTPNMVLANNCLLASNSMDTMTQWILKMTKLCSGVAKAIVADRPSL